MSKIFLTSTLIFLHHSFLLGVNGLTAEITDLNAKDISFQKEKELPYLKKPFISSSPADKNDQLNVGRLGIDGGKKESILKFVRKLAEPSDSPKHGKTDSLLIAHQGKLIFESYFRRGRANYPHYQMSITKSYTAYAIGRAIQLGYLSMDDLHKPVVSFLKEIKPDKLAKGADKITLDQAMQMRSGIRLPKKKIGEIIQRPSLLRGQGQARAYLQFSQDLPVLSDSSLQPFKYQSSDTVLTMQVLEAVVPGTAEAFIREQLLKPMHINNYGWQEDLSGFPKAAAGSSLLSRDMIKMGLLTLNQGKWRGQQHLPLAFVKKATTPLLFNGTTDTDYGYFWWHQVRKVKDKKYPCIQGRGAGGQFIFVFPTLDLVASVTAHNQGMGKMLRDLPEILIPAFSEN
ncbi:MAG: serine hydrolase [Opitutae bacterium]|nr:serine hydrolase [Opitutae bacterium]